MIAVDPALLTERENYILLAGSVIPRPIAYITTRSPEGIVNAAPFSYFSIVTADPPMVAISVQRKAGIQKDTARNALSGRSFVVHIADKTMAESVNRASASLPPDTSELTLTGQQTISSTIVPVPGIAEAKIRLECILDRTFALGGSEGAPACDMLIGRVVYFHIAEDVYKDGYIDHAMLDPLSRLSGSWFGTLGECFSLARPD